MKKLFLTIFFVCAIFVLLSQGELLWGKLSFLDEPRIHQVRKGEYLSKLAQQHYGDAQYWRELAMVNRAPKPDHIEVGEEILLPSAAVIKELSRSRTLTRVNALVGNEEKIAVRPAPEPANGFTERREPTNGTETAAPVETPMTTTDEESGIVPETTSPEAFTPVTDTVIENTGFPWFWLAIGLILVAGIVGFIWYRRKQSREDAEVEMETERQRNSLDAFPRDHRPFASQERQNDRITV